MKRRTVRKKKKTDPDEDVIFVCEKLVPGVPEVPVNWGKLQVLQRDIDHESQYQTPTSKNIESMRSLPAKELIENRKLTVNEDSKKDMVKTVTKEKKNKIPDIKRDSKLKTEEMLGEMSENNIQKKKKRKMPDDVNNPDAEEVYKKKKLIKSNKQMVSADNIEEPMKDKKKINKSIQSEPNVEFLKIEKVQNAYIDNLQEKKKSKKAKKVKNETVVTNMETMKKKEKKKSKQLAEEEDISVIETLTIKKSKKNKLQPAEKETKMECFDSCLIENVKVKKKIKDKTKAEKKITPENLSNNTKDETEESDVTQIKKKKHKKTKPERNMVVDCTKYKNALDVVNVTDSLEPKQKKKKKTKEKNDGEPLPLDSKSDDMCKGKQKKRSKKLENTIDTEAATGQKTKKKKIKEERLDLEEPSQVDVVFLSEKTGNTDEVNINKERRQALQMEIDQASQPPKPATPLGLGQWGTAEFGSSEQQQKFLRLMGGFKKGFQPASSSRGGGNMALGRDAQQQLQKGLLGEFERAHSRRMDSSNRGSGLGFTAPSKKFSIDANVSRSIRFDD